MKSRIYPKGGEIGFGDMTPHRRSLFQSLPPVLDAHLASLRIDPDIVQPARLAYDPLEWPAAGIDARFKGPVPDRIRTRLALPVTD